MVKNEYNKDTNHEWWWGCNNSSNNFSHIKTVLVDKKLITGITMDETDQEDGGSVRRVLEEQKVLETLTPGAAMAGEDIHTRT